MDFLILVFSEKALASSNSFFRVAEGKNTCKNQGNTSTGSEEVLVSQQEEWEGRPGSPECQEEAGWQVVMLNLPEGAAQATWSRARAG